MPKKSDHPFYCQTEKDWIRWRPRAALQGMLHLADDVELVYRRFLDVQACEPSGVVEINRHTLNLMKINRQKWNRISAILLSKNKLERLTVSKESGESWVNSSMSDALLSANSRVTLARAAGQISAVSRSNQTIQHQRPLERPLQRPFNGRSNQLESDSGLENNQKESSSPLPPQNNNPGNSAIDLGIKILKLIGIDPGEYQAAGGDFRICLDWLSRGWAESELIDVIRARTAGRNLSATKRPFQYLNAFIPDEMAKQAEIKARLVAMGHRPTPGGQSSAALPANRLPRRIPELFAKKPDCLDPEEFYFWGLLHEYFNGKSSWPLGPLPGDPACKAPKHLVDRWLKAAKVAA